MLEWSEKYSTGLPEVDDQHKRLFQVINKLSESIERGIGEDFLDHTLEFLSNYVKDHFGYEEECMEKYHCPVAEKNFTEHQKFLKNLETYYTRYREGAEAEELIKDIHHECEEWIVRHICDVDVHLRSCVHKLQT